MEGEGENYAPIEITPKKVRFSIIIPLCQVPFDFLLGVGFHHNSMTIEFNSWVIIINNFNCLQKVLESPNVSIFYINLANHI